MKPLFNQNDINIIKEYFINKKQTIAVAESVTAGFMQVALSTAEEASGFFHGGITAYNIGQKSKHLAIDSIHAMACNCVSEKIAQQMAMGVCELFKSDWGIGITGYATPVPESDNKLFAFYAIVYQETVVLAKKITVKDGEPIDNQLTYTNHVLKDLSTHLQKD
jgi:nicotinamide-nucleotide amidase